MTDRENFLERWSRRKADADRESRAPAAEEENAPSDSTEDRAQAAPSPTSGDDSRAPTSAQPAPPAFDIANLPSIESITAGTDVRAFLVPGVPPALARAALRRAWSADPVIRDFKGLAENDWDFTDPNAIAGFGELPQDFDVRRAIAQLFRRPGEAAESSTSPVPEPEPQVAQISAESTETHDAERMPEPDVSPLEKDVTTSDSAFLPQRANNIATQHDRADSEQDQPKIRRSHGRALPQ